MPVDRLIQFNHPFSHISSADKPGLARIIDHRDIIKTPAERIGVLDGLFFIELSFDFQFFNNSVISVFNKLLREIGNVISECSVPLYRL